MGDMPTRPIVLANLTLRFALELAALAALGYAGFNSGADSIWAWALGLGAPLAAAALWGILVAPRSSRQLRYPVRLIPELVVFGSAAAALVAVGQTGAGLTFSTLVALHLILQHLLG